MSSNNGVTGKLSSRVMNMKFMKFMKNDDDESSNSNTPSNANSDTESTEQKWKQFGRDNSEWDLNSCNDDVKGDSGNEKKKVKKLVYKKRPHLIVSNVGYSELRKAEGLITGRKTFGSSADEANPKKRKLEEGEQEEEEEGKGYDQKKEAVGKQDEGEDDYDLDKLFKDSIKKKMTNQTKKPKKKKSK
ncbi:hypothetical protein SUVZ_14G3430 [Saccharomyces uvarum]|uniref:M-phase phosphoprotein 6 n=1 Tax=Saccharomyces uvarum TaxID=230603 RepID=A0ABN8WJY3_SACUV|nr:hypothetical protein SUVZ_14G3430 [Saccharomyces uvarum]